MKKIIQTLILAALVSPTFAQSYQRGLLPEDGRYSTMPRIAEVEKLGEMPTRISYEAFAPQVADQGPYNSSVAFAVGYYLRTMLDAKVDQLTVRAKITESAYSPGYLYNQIKAADDPNCQKGGSLVEAFQYLETYGLLRLAQTGPMICGQTFALQPDPTSRIGAYGKIFEISDEQDLKIFNAKKALGDGFPIVIGMRCPDSFLGIKDVWNPTKAEISSIQAINTGQALCVVGYDDARFGGAFRVLNSWGSGWGQSGYGWIKYADFGRFVKYGIQCFPPSNRRPATPTASPEVLLAGTVDFQLVQGAAVPVKRSLLSKGTLVADDPAAPSALVAYQLATPYPSGTSFKFNVVLNKPTYLYVIGSDLRNSVSALFPYSASVSARISGNSRMLLPSPNQNYMLDNNPGTDYWLFLYSDKELDLASINQKISRAPGTFIDKVLGVLGRELIDPQSIQYYTDRVGFELKGQPKGSIVPLLVSLEHR